MWRPEDPRSLDWSAGPVLLSSMARSNQFLGDLVLGSLDWIVHAKGLNPPRRRDEWGPNELVLLRYTATHSERPLPVLLDGAVSEGNTPGTPTLPHLLLRRGARTKVTRGR